MYAGVPTAPRVTVSWIRSAALATPKSMTRGPSGDTSTLDGFRSRCTNPAPWIDSSASAQPAASHRTAGTGSGPQVRTSVLSDGRRHVRGRQPRHVGLGIGRDDRGGEGPADPPGRGHLLGEAGAEVRLLRELDLDRLDRDQPPRGRPAEIDLPHRAGAQPADQRVAADLLRVPPAQRLGERSLRQSSPLPLREASP